MPRGTRLDLNRSQDILDSLGEEGKYLETLKQAKSHQDQVLLQEKQTADADAIDAIFP